MSRSRHATDRVGCRRRRLRFPAAVLCLGAGTVAAALAGAVEPWHSRLLPPAGGIHAERPVLQFAGRQWQLPDFSYVGHALGERSGGDGIPCRVFPVDPGTEDLAAALERAIAAAGAAGGGVVRIPPGRFRLARSVGIDGDRIAVVGAGSARTVIEVPPDYTPARPGDEGLFTIGKPAGGWHKAWVDRGEVLGALAARADAGSREVLLGEGAPPSPGEWVVLLQYFWQEFSRRHSGGDWPWHDGPPDPQADREGAFAYLRRVVAVDGRRLTLDAPVPRRLDPADHPVWLLSAQRPAWIAPRHGLLLGGMRIEFADNRSGPGGRPAGAGVHIEGVRDAVVADVQVVNAPRYGIRLDHAARTTLYRVAVRGVQDYGEGGYGYGIAIAASQAVLVRESLVEDARHGITLRSPLSSDVVIRESSSWASRGGGDDLHHGYSHQVLWDAHALRHGTGLHAVYRGRLSRGAHETNGTQVLWNVHGDGYRGGWYGGSIHLNPAGDGWNVVVGSGRGAPVWDAGPELGRGQRIPPGAGLVVGHAEGRGAGARDGNVLFEGVGRAGLQPRSLHAAQLAARLGREPEPLAACFAQLAAAGPPAPSLRPGPAMLVFDSDHIGWVPGAGHGCSGCDFDASRAAHGRGQGAALGFSARDWDLVASFRGPVLDGSRARMLQLRLRAPSDGLSLRIRLALHGWPEGQRRTVADWRSPPLPAGRWTTVSMPIDSATGPFNAIELRSAGVGGEVWIDDVELLPATAAAG